MSRRLPAGEQRRWSRTPGWVRTWWRELGTYRLPLGLLVALLVVTSGVLTAAPLATRATASAQLHHLLGTAPAGQRDAAVVGQLDPDRVPVSEGEGTDPTSDMCGYDHGSAAARLTDQLPEDVRRVTGATTWSSTTRSGISSSPDGQDIILFVRAQSHLDGTVDWVAGGMPQQQGITRAGLRASRAPSALVDVAVSVDTAERLHLAIGTVLGVAGAEGVKEPDPGYYWSHPVRLRVAGIYRPKDPAAGPWSEEKTLVAPATYLDSGRRTALVTALVPGEKYRDLCEGVAYDAGGDDPGAMPAAMAHDWRVPVAATAQVTDIPTLRTFPEDVRAAAESAGLPLRVIRTQSSLPTLLDAARHDAIAAQTVLGTFYAALGVLSASSLLLLTLAMMDRRRPALRRMAARGASVLQLARVVLLPLAALTILAPALTCLAVRAAFGAWPEPWSLAAAAVVATAPLPVAAARLRSEAARGTGRAPRVRRAARLRTLVALVLLVVMAAVGLAQLRRTDVAARDLRDIDPFLAGVPVVLVLTAVTVVAVLMPAALRAAARVARRGRGAVALAGLARASRSGALVAFPLVSLAVGLAFTQLALGMATAAPSGRTTAATHALLGRTYVTGPTTPEEMARLGAVQGVRETVPVHLTSAPATEVTGPDGPRVVVADPAAYSRVLEDAGLPHDLSAITGVPTPAKAWGYRVPAVVGGAPGAMGRTLTLDVGGSRVEVVVAGTLPALTAGATQDQPVVVLPAGVMAVVAPEALPTGAFVLADGNARAALARGDAGVPSFWHAQDVQRIAQEVASRPLSRYLSAAVATCAGLAALHVVLALVLVLRLTGRARAEAVARLRTMGLTRRQVLGVSLVESLPVGVLGTVVGLWSASALTTLLGPQVDLAAFTGGVPHPGIVPPWWAPCLLAAAALLLYALVVVLDAARSRRRGLATTLRMGDAP